MSLQVRGIDVCHGQLRAVADFSLDLADGQVVAVIGANGAGKSTLLRSLAGTMPVTKGTILLGDRDVTGMSAPHRVAAGLSLVPEGRRLFASLSVEENLLTGTYRARKGPWNVEAVMDLFGWMRDRRRQNSAQLSGGEQQVVAIGRALVSNPSVLLIDELSLGLAPVIVQRIYAMLPRIVAEGTSILLVEQDISQALRASDYVHCLLEGRTVLCGRPSDLTAAQIETAYFGLENSAG